jgi:hypothetical protein
MTKIHLPQHPTFRDWPYSHEQLRARDLEVARAVQEACAKVCDAIYRASRQNDKLEITIGKAGRLIRTLEFDV